MSALALGVFQFSNLLSMRVPFVLCHNGIDFSKKFSGQELEHIKRYSRSFLEPAELIELMKAEGYPLYSPVIWICDDGVLSKEFADRGEVLGLPNCHFIEGGFAALVVE